MIGVSTATNVLRMTRMLGRAVRSFFLPNADSVRFMEFARRQFGATARGRDGVVIADIMPSEETQLAYSFFCRVVAEKHNSSLAGFETSGGWGQWINNAATRRVYRSFGCSRFVRPRLNLDQRRRSADVLRRCRADIAGFSKCDLLDYRLDDLWIGIDIYESYLRLGKSTLDMSDPAFWDILSEAVDLLVFWQDFFENNKVTSVVVSHDSYIYYGFVCKLAYRLGIPVYHPNCRGVTFASEPFSISRCFLDYRKMFADIPIVHRAGLLALAKVQLLAWMRGTKTNEMQYTIGSAFSAAGEKKRYLRPSARKKLVIATHCFYDNPHGYAKLPYADFIEWMEHLAHISRETDYDWYLKTHPAPAEIDVEAVREFIAKHSHITQLPPEATWYELAADGLDYVTTMHGSVGHELPLLGIGVLNGSYNPHIAYDFTYTSTDPNDYSAAILNLERVPRDIDESQVHEFFATNYFLMTADSLIFRSFRDYSSRGSGKAFSCFLDDVSSERCAQILARLSAFIDSGESFLRASEEEIAHFAKMGQSAEKA